MQTELPDPQPIGYSLLRFSTPEQAKGDSRRRQTTAAKEWCERKGIPLDTSLWAFDPAVSGFTGQHRKNPDRHALAAFLGMIETKRVRPGSFLIVENLDRLTREEEVPACHLLTGILMAGICVVQLSPSELFLTDKSSGFDIMRAVMELSRGHGESAMKADRNGKAWQAKVTRARDGGEVLTHRLPAWVKEEGGKLLPIPDRANVVKRIFHLAGNGYGVKAIVRRLTDEKVPAFGRTGVWGHQYVAMILKDRRALGEFRPCGPGSKPTGEVIKGYFPAVVTELDFDLARAGTAGRKGAPGRVGEHINLFTSLLVNARDGDHFWESHKSARRGGQRILVNRAGAHGRAPNESFPADVFERAVLSCLGEINPHDILNGDGEPDESLTLAAELSRVEEQIAKVGAELEDGDVKEGFRVLRRLEARQTELAGKLAVAHQKAAHPLSKSWGETQSLIDALDTAPDPPDARRRLRSALSRIVDSIYLLIVPRGWTRLCAVQVWFKERDRHRDYLIFHQPPHDNGSARKEGGWWVRSSADVVKLGKLDLRKPEHAKRLEAALRAADLSK
jgi:DNA invertase Pin-like site-specific DNA recombinase